MRETPFGHASGTRTPRWGAGGFGAIRHLVILPDTFAFVRWLTFILFAYLMLGLQIGLGGLAGVKSAQINFPLIAAVFISINARRDPALVACFVLGLFATAGTWLLGPSGPHNPMFLLPWIAWCLAGAAVVAELCVRAVRALTGRRATEM